MIHYEAGSQRARRKTRDLYRSKALLHGRAEDGSLLISLMAPGIKPGDEITTASFTFVATAEVIVL